MRLIRLLALMACLGAGFLSFAQNPYYPPNPVAPPQIPSPQAVAPPVVTLPEVTAPVLDGQGPESRADMKKNVPASGAASIPETAQSSEPGSFSATAFSLINALGGETGNAGTQGDDTLTMEKILELLEKQQEQQKQQEPVPAAPAKNSRAEKPAQPSGSEILRFTVNGYNVATTITGLLSSTVARDGSFLLTGTRVYPTSGGQGRETFYLLCKKDASGQYRLFTDVSQNATNENSYLYQLVRKSPLKGSLTGDLLVFRTGDPAWNLDLVIRIETDK